MANPKLCNIVKKYRCSNSDLLWAIFLLLLIPIWIGIAPELYSWFAIEGNGLWMKWLYNFLNGLYFVNIPISIFISYFAYRWNVRIWKDKDIRPFRVVLVLIAFIFLWYGSNVVYANIMFGVDYRMFMSCWLTITLFIQISKAVRTIVNIHKDLSKNGDAENVGDNKIFNGFSLDKPKEQNENNSLKQYASMIAKKLMSTDINDQSYAIGIMGEWGVGKTSFLNLLKNEIAEKAEIVEFNPWMCRSPEQVTNDFFASLRHQLSPKYSTLSKSIKEYAKYINNITLEPHKALGLEMSLPLKEDSLYEKKKILSEKFSRLPHPVVVVIDDIDRLEREEVFEVLRLIRNTADLNNTIYLVAYDKEYVTGVLEEKNIKDATSYLEKIFPVEVHLPKVEDNLIWKTLYDELRSHDNFKGKFTKSLFARFNNDERVLILRVLNNYRRVKRFTSIFMLNFDYIMEQCRGEIKLLDLFWLEILQLYDKNVYDKLANDPYSLLYIEKDRLNLKKDILQSDNEDGDIVYKNEFWKKETPKILEQMFGNHIKTRKESICYLENYDKYFILGVSPYRVSYKELKKLFADGSDPENIVIQWVDNGKYFSSIAYQLSHVYIKDLSDNLLKNYLYGILAFALKIVPYCNYQFMDVKKMLQKDRYEEVNKKDIAHSDVLEWFNGKLGNDENLLNLSGLLKKLYLTKTYDQDNQEEYQCPLVISNEEIESFLTSGMQNYLDNHPEITACDLIKENSILFSLFRNCCLNVENNINEDYDSYKQVVFKIVIEHFTRKDAKPTLKKYKELYKSLNSQEAPVVFADSDEESAYWDFMEYSMDNKMKRIFGDSYNQDMEEFKNKCFVAE